MKKRVALLLTVYLGVCGFTTDSPPFQDTSLPFEKRVDDLTSRMTLEEKIGQMNFRSPAIPHLGIPAYNWWNECLHGVGRAGHATVFPQAIGMAAMWDAQGMLRIATAISDEARAKYHDFERNNKRGIYQGLTFWTPNVNIFRDPRWGRGMETYGEDPYLTGKLATHFIKGLQGEDSRYLKVVATAKHFAVHSGPESTRHSADVLPNRRDLAETYFPHFERTVTDANVWSVMCAYQRFDGMPCCGSQFLENQLRNLWGFKGYIVSDCGAIKDFYEKGCHEVVATPAEAAAMAVKAGTDLNCGDVYPHLKSAVEKGFISEAEIDRSVKRLLLARMKLGMFDPPAAVPYAQIPLSVVDSKQHQQLALEMSRQSIVLLKNKGILPLRKSLKRVAVIGPNADDVDALIGNYYGFSSNPQTPFSGIKKKLPSAQVVYAQGSPLAQELPHLENIPSRYLYTDESCSVQGLAAAYFDNRNLSGNPIVNRVDSAVNFTWWTSLPAEKISNDSFSVRWKGVLRPPVSGRYAIGGEAFSGMKITFDQTTVIAYESEHHPQKEYEYVDLKAGQTYPIVFEYRQNQSTHPMAVLMWEMPKPNLMDEAVALARTSDVVILCMGLSPRLEGEEMRVKVPGFKGGDREDIQLPAIQLELIKKIHATGTPTVLVLMNGSALAFNWEAENVPAILEAWYPGQAGGEAIADILFGDYNPSGKLPVTFYKSIDQLPPFDDYNMQGKTYRYFAGEPLFPFGFGLSYSRFEYRKPVLSSPVIKKGEGVVLKVDVKNNSRRDGIEVVQVYIKFKGDLDGPLKSLRAFQRVAIPSGKTREVRFELSSDDFKTYDSEFGDMSVAKGEYEIKIGSSSADKDLQNITLMIR